VIRGIDTIAKCGERKYDLIISDLNMPELNGVETVKKIRTSTINELTPIIFVTGNMESETAKEALSLKPVDLIPKPIDVKYLVEVARKVLSI